MARTAIPGRLTWRAATVTAVRDETPTARTLTLDVPGWPGHLAGQHVDVRLTAPDGYSAQRSYSLASASPTVELTVQVLADGEVSPYLGTAVKPGDQLELRGPVGGWFVWRPTDPAPVLLVAGGSGIVPLMAMIRTRAAAGSRTPFRLVHSARTPADALYATELARRTRDDAGLDVHHVWSRTAGRLTVATLNTHGWPPDFAPACYVCGPTGFVEAAADMLVALGHSPRLVKTERFGGTP
ncbi:ferredoxin reductase [Spirilliplanes yamanashiensis]|uniref:Oxidoreductase n=1 Tax=Spirilliplanes yamanashiensis TaxID=42233 RepID=A0A8J3Y9H4_9ACTN|nr:ferredoxin reductase [Spirilliplanes yamanashiensis]MDP9817558.1 ferredoxin-NADP reductase [Spirilliplanes yamanashiensis]GIJ04368.1 oxidoreductase [Spirilliplanes yamanashiensis]